MRLHNKWIIGIAVFLMAGISNARAQDILVDLQLLQPNAQIFNVGDFDFLEAGTAQDYFLLTLQNNGPEECRVRMTLQVFLNADQIALGETNDFVLPGNFSVVLQSSLLASGAAMVNGQSVKLTFTSDNINFEAIENLEDRILTTGFLPAGRYRFLTTVIKLDASGNPIGSFIDENEDNHTLEITNPTTLELLFPGRSVSERDLVEVATTFPYFQWYSDAAPSATRYNIFVYEKFSEDRTVQDVLNHPPVLQVEGYLQNFFQYPTDPNPTLLSGRAVGPVRLLESGKTYYWFVESIIPTATTPLNLQSDVFRFKVADVAQNTSQAPQILTFLRQVLGQNYEGVLEALLEEGFEPNGVITMDGNSVQSSELLELLNQILQGKLKLSRVESF